MDFLSTRRVPYVTFILIGLNLIYFLVVEWVGSSENTMDMLKMGAGNAFLILEGHQYWRLLTSMFMHFGVSHICNNMFVLFLLGDNLERALGRVKYIILYLVAGIGANIASVYMDVLTGNNYVSAGASGAIFGVVGGLLWAVIANRGRLEDLTTRQLLVMMGISLYFGFTSSGIDNTAHIAGGVIGFVCSMILYRKPRNRWLDQFGD